VISFIIARAKKIQICIMTTSQDIRKKARSGRAVRSEPQDLELINEDPNVREYFEHVRCMHYCENIQGYNPKLDEQFALRFNGFHATIVGTAFRVTEETLSSTMEIPLHGERWSKGMHLDILCYEDFIKTKFLNREIIASVPSPYIHEPLQKILNVIRRYFTHERRSDRIYPHHIMFLMHFTRKRPLNLPFFLH
jgi:hypothetical protein